jgi:PAS domain-containing protein
MFDAALNALAEASGAALLAADAEGRILSHNERFEKMWNVPPSVMAARSLPDLARWLRETNEAVAARLATVLEEQVEANTGELTQDGGRIIAWSSRPFDAGGHSGQAGRVWAFHDMTQARQTASSLRDAENWLAMFEAHTDGIVLELDADIRVVGMWATKTVFFEQPDAELQGRSLKLALGEAAGAVFDEHIARVFSTGQPQSFEYILDSNGKRRVFAANAILLAGDERAPRVTVLVQDITARAIGVGRAPRGGRCARNQQSSRLCASSPRAPSPWARRASGRAVRRCTARGARAVGGGLPRRQPAGP